MSISCSARLCETSLSAAADGFGDGAAAPRRVVVRVHRRRARKMRFYGVGGLDVGVDHAGVQKRGS